jgi:methionyl-tRNA formyltransferase
MSEPRILFMGTPEFAVATLGALLINGFNVVSVVTAPDKPSGRGRKLSVSPVREFAELSNLRVFQPENLKDPDFVKTITDLKPDIIVVVAFRMLPEVIWRIPSAGTFNLHASLLPQYRGAAPINHVIINGETRTGVTTFFIDDKIDTGNILLREEVHINSIENAGDLHDRLMKQGARLVIKTLEGLISGSLKPQPQELFMENGEIMRTAPKIFPEDCIINWKKDTISVHNLVRGLSPSPCAKTILQNSSTQLSVKIFESLPELISHSRQPGKILTDGREYMKIACSDGYLNILSLRIEGKKRMSISEFLRGFRIGEYTVQFS